MQDLERITTPDGLYTLMVPTDTDWDPVPPLDRLIGGWSARVYHTLGHTAHYHLQTDTIRLPERRQFPSAANYYGSALHELAHSTMHPDRMHRYDECPSPDTLEYAIEELRAEMTSWILLARYGLDTSTTNRALYIDSWRGRLEMEGETPKQVTDWIVGRAATDAEAIADWIMANSGD